MQHSFAKNVKKRKERKKTQRTKHSSAKNVTFFCKEHKRTQRTQHSFAKNVIERKACNVLLQKNAELCILLKRMHTQPSFFFSIYIQVYRYIYRYIQIIIYINIYCKKNIKFFFNLKKERTNLLRSFFGRFVIFV